jgi:hypothetical protein
MRFIQNMVYGLMLGGIRKHGVAMFAGDIITADGDYHFVNFQGMLVQFSLLMLLHPVN